MAQQVIDRTATTTGDPAAAYALLADGATWPEWSPIDSFELLAPGNPVDGEPEGLGAVRLFKTGPVKSRERVVERRPGVAFSYVLEKGLPLRDYNAVVTMRPTPEGTLIRWRSTFRAKVPGTGWIYRRQLGGFIGRCVQGLATAADRSRTP
jgi:hypothetical protein